MKGTRDRGNKGTRERGNEGTRERGNEGTRERNASACAVPTGLRVSSLVDHPPTLKRGANIRCAYGAGLWLGNEGARKQGSGIRGQGSEKPRRGVCSVPLIRKSTRMNGARGFITGTRTGEASWGVCSVPLIRKSTRMNGARGFITGTRTGEASWGVCSVPLIRKSTRMNGARGFISGTRTEEASWGVCSCPTHPQKYADEWGTGLHYWDEDRGGFLGSLFVPLIRKSTRMNGARGFITGTRTGEASWGVCSVPLIRKSTRMNGARGFITGVTGGDDGGGGDGDDDGRRPGPGLLRWPGRLAQRQQIECGRSS